MAIRYLGMALHCSLEDGGALHDVSAKLKPDRPITLLSICRYEKDTFPVYIPSAYFLMLEVILGGEESTPRATPAGQEGAGFR